ncbi:unnamed protein product [Rhizoctonia solani]|uniref:Uncharacterized protein n=1 Tax=Rhizoctonia solani TaxID=456999 RepID=A0A8H3ATB8_9AGAM|nr:unnamed protein product [Rhizoctonia solani]
MVVFIISGASYGLGRELVRQASLDDRNVIFALVKSAKAAEQLTDLTSARNNIHVYFQTQEDRQAGYKLGQKTAPESEICKSRHMYTVYAHRLTTVFRIRTDHYPNQMNDLQRFFSNHVLDVIRITNAFIPLLDRGSLKKVVTLTSEGVSNSHSILPSGLDVGVAYTMARTALDMAMSRYSAIHELRQKGFVYTIIESGSIATSGGKDNYHSKVREVAREILEMIERLRHDNSGRCTKLRERDLITL